MPKTAKELPANICIHRMNRFARRTLKAMMDNAKRPALARWYEAHPEVLADLIRRADINRKFTFDYEKEFKHASA